MFQCERGRHFQYNWLSSQEGGQFLQSVWPRAHPRPVQWGLLETPPHPLAEQRWQVFPYKIAVLGRSGVGKSEFVALVTGQSPPPDPCETPGLSVQRQFWPCRPQSTGRPLLCRLDFWEAGDAAGRSFEHLRHELSNRCDCVLFVFSAADRASFAELPQLTRRTLGAPECQDVCGALLVTKLDLPSAQVVSQRDLRQLERDCQLPLLRFAPGMAQEACGQLLTRLCEVLWHRDQVTSGVVETSVPSKGKK